MTPTPTRQEFLRGLREFLDKECPEWRQIMISEIEERAAREGGSGWDRIEFCAQPPEGEPFVATLLMNPDREPATTFEE